MVLVFFMIIEFINVILLINFVGAEQEDSIQSLTIINQTLELFNRFKENYNRVYPDTESERKAFDTFCNNLAEVRKLNKEHPGQVVAYQLNRFADQEPEEIKDMFGIHLKPYDNMEHGNKEAVKREHRHKFLEDMNLHDLNNVDDLYKEWIKKWSKANFTKKVDKMAHYYRFVKTVVETNNKKFAGEDVSLGADADLIREPNQYFYGK